MTAEQLLQAITAKSGAPGSSTCSRERARGYRTELLLRRQYARADPAFYSDTIDVPNYRDFKGYSPLMKQIHTTNNEAPKLSGFGNLKYQLWVDSSGSLYVQIANNAAAGTFSPLLFSVAKYASKRTRSQSIGNPAGLDLSGSVERQSEDNNDGAFLKAVLKHLLDGDVSV